MALCPRCKGQMGMMDTICPHCKYDFPSDDSLPHAGASVLVGAQLLRCQVCGHDEFNKRSAQLNTALATFFDMDWANESATCYVCKTCGYVHWFVRP